MVSNVRGVAFAEDPVVPHAPALHLAGHHEGAGVVIASDDLVRHHARPEVDFYGIVSYGRVALAQLTIIVVAPAPYGPVRADGAGVVPPN